MTPTTETETLWRDHHATLLNYVKRRADDEAEDIVQDVYLSALEAMQRGVGYMRHASGWLYRIARNRMIDGYRHRDRAPQWVEIDEMLDGDDSERGRQRGEVLKADGPTPHELTERRLDVEMLRQATRHLQPDQAYVINRRADGAEFDEIAAELGKSIGAVKAMQHRAFVVLRPYLDPAFVMPASESRPRGLSHRAQQIRDALIAHGPMMTSQIATCCDALPQTVNNIIANHAHIFVLVGYRARQGGAAKVWGLVDVHSTQGDV